MIARRVWLISCFTATALSSATDIAVTIACVTRGWRSSARGRAAQHVGDAVGRRVATRWALIEAFPQRRRLVRHAGEQELILRRVVPVERPERDLGPRRDITHLHRVVAALGRERRRGRQQSLLAGRGLRGAGAASSRRVHCRPAHCHERHRSPNLERVAGSRTPTVRSGHAHEARQGDGYRVPDLRVQPLPRRRRRGQPRRRNGRAGRAVLHARRARDRAEMDRRPRRRQALRRRPGHAREGAAPRRGRRREPRGAARVDDHRRSTGTGSRRCSPSTTCRRCPTTSSAVTTSSAGPTRPRVRSSTSRCSTRRRCS